jgi:hypothetical protein
VPGYIPTKTTNVRCVDRINLTQDHQRFYENAEWRLPASEPPRIQNGPS